MGLNSVCTVSAWMKMIRKLGYISFPAFNEMLPFIFTYPRASMCRVGEDMGSVSEKE
jgi:hypothetical protein